MNGRILFKKLKFIIIFSSTILKFSPKFFRIFLWDCMSKYSQILFIGLRYLILKSLVKSCGNNVRIGTNVTITHWESFTIGDNVSIHSNCYLDGAGGIEVGNDVSIAHNSSILSSNHSWEDNSMPIKYNPVLLKKVILENDVWIGCGCRILAGVTISSRTIIAAGAVVNKNTDGNSIYGGIPAKKIKSI